jgi:hypothetical protein
MRMRFGGPDDLEDASSTRATKCEQAEDLSINRLLDFIYPGRNSPYSSSPSSSSPIFEGATPPNIGGTSFGGSALGDPAELARRAFEAAGFRAAFLAPRGAGFFLPFAFPGAFLALFLARLAVFRFGVRFATLPAAFFAGFFAVFRFVAI